MNRSPVVILPDAEAARLRATLDALDLVPGSSTEYTVLGLNDPAVKIPATFLGWSHFDAVFHAMEDKIDFTVPCTMIPDYVRRTGARK